MILKQVQNDKEESFYYIKKSYMKKDIYSKLFKENWIDIIETNKLVEFIADWTNTSDSYHRTKTATALINIKAIRAQTKAIEEQTKAINNNSKSSDYLSKVWIFVWIVWTLATIIWTIFWILAYISNK